MKTQFHKFFRYRNTFVGRQMAVAATGKNDDHTSFAAFGVEKVFNSTDLILYNFTKLDFHCINLSAEIQKL